VTLQLYTTYKSKIVTLIRARMLVKSVQS